MSVAETHVHVELCEWLFEITPLTTHHAPLLSLGPTPHTKHHTNKTTHTQAHLSLIHS